MLDIQGILKVIFSTTQRCLGDTDPEFYEGHYISYFPKFSIQIDEITDLLKSVQVDDQHLGLLGSKPKPLK